MLLLVMVLESLLYADESCVVDDLNTSICLQNNAERIVSLSPHITELIYAIGADDRLVGVMRGSDYPSDAAGKAVVGNYQSVSSERILEVNPDFIVSWPAAVPASNIGLFRKFGIAVYQSDPVTLEGIKDNIEELGILTGQQRQADQVLADMHKALEILELEFKHVSTVSAVILISERPLMALSNKGLIKEAFNLCAARNIFADLHAEAAMISPEALVKEKPDYILTTFPVDKKSLLARMGLSLSDNVSVVEINPDLILRQTPRFLQGVNEFCNALHPD